MKSFFTVLMVLCAANCRLFSQTATNSTPEKTLTVQVQTPDGKPVPDITVVEVDSSTNAFLTDLTIKGGGKRFQTDDQGRFTFTLRKENLFFMLATDSGFGLAQSRDLTNDAVMVVQPWARIKGTRTNRGRSVVGQRIMLQLDTRCIDSWDSQTRTRIGVDDKTTTDSNGEFVFDHVPPSGVVLYEVEQSKELWNFLAFTALDPGENRSLQIATDGRTITGLLEPDDDLATNLDLKVCDVNLVPNSMRRGFIPTIPTEFDTPQKRTRWWEAWYRSDAGKAVFRPVGQRGADFEIKSNGIFASDIVVAPGRYWVSGELREDGKKIGKVDQYVVIPADKPGDADSFDIGKITLKPALGVGDMAPGFNVPTLDGKKIALADFRGKYVLLDFWATWCVPCVAETPNLDATYRAFGKDSRFVMISLSLDESTAEPIKFVGKNHIEWDQGFLGDWGQDTVTKSFEISSIPSIWLIGPDGKIISRSLRGAKIKETVASALNAK